MNRKMRDVYAKLNASVPLMKLAPAREKEAMRIINLSPDTTEVFVYGEIGMPEWWGEGGVTANGFLRELSHITTKNIDVRINSGGGSVFEAIAMHTGLRRHSAFITTYVDALAASAASFLAMAGDKIVTEQGGMWMIHAASVPTFGTAKDHRESADLLDKVTENTAEFYAIRCGGTTEEWLEKLNSGDTWYTADEAFEEGLTDEVVKREAPDAVSDKLRKWSNRLPDDVRNSLPVPAPPSVEPQEPEIDLRSELARGLLAARLIGA